MERLPKNLEAVFVVELDRRSFEPRVQSAWRKWARFFVDFSLKNGHPPRDLATVPLFLEKLASKGQDGARREEARCAVALLQELMARFGRSEPATGEMGRTSKREGAGDVEPRLAEEPDGSYQADQVSARSPRPSGRDEKARGGDSWETELGKLGEALAVGQYALATRKTYRYWARQLQYFTKSAPPEGLDSEAVAAFLTHLATEKKVGAATQNQAFNALLFFFRHVLDREFKPEGVVRVRATRYIPQTLTRAQIDELTSELDHPHSLLARLLYGCGLRLTEALNLRVHNFDFDIDILTVHRGKGQKDRTVPIPEALKDDLLAHLKDVRQVFEGDLEAGFDGAFMPQRGSAKEWDTLAKRWQWQFFFSAVRLTKVKGGDELRRYHLHGNRFSEQLRRAVEKSGIHKKVSAHTFRHSFASHLLMANYDIKTIQEMLGHSNIRTTMIYVQTVPDQTKKRRRSPLDLPPGEVG